MSTAPTGLQEWIHKLEEGEWTRYLKYFVALLGFVALTVLYDLREYKNFYAPEAMEAAQLARNLSEGKGFTTEVIRPLDIVLLQKHTGQADVLQGAHPDLRNPPVYPVLLAVLMKVLPFRYDLPEGADFNRYQPEVLIALLNQGFFFVAVLLVFCLAKRLFDLSVAWVATLILAGADIFWRFSVSGLSTMLLLVLVLVMVWCLVLMEEQSREENPRFAKLLGLAVATGMLLGIGGLTRYAFAWMALPVLAFALLFLGQRRVALSVAIGLSFLVVMTPWLIRNYAVSGTLFGTAGFALHEETTYFPSNRLERSLDPSVLVRVGQIGMDEYVRKLLEKGGTIVQNDLPKLGGSWVTAFFLAGLLVPFRNPTLNRLRIWLLLSLVVLAVVQALGRTHLSTDTPEINTENLLVLLAPLVFIYGSGMFFMLLDQWELPFIQLRNLVVGVFVLLATAGLIFTLLPPRSVPAAYPPYYPPLIHGVGRWMEEHELVMSDMPWGVAWYGDQKSIWVTLNSQEDFFAINDFQQAVQGLYLTQLTTDQRFLTEMLRSPEGAWGRFVLECYTHSNVPTGFPLKHAPSGFPLPDQWFLADRPRWDQAGK